jgi:4a-hydroxytetrahydrobiopterin dehydratase
MNILNQKKCEACKAGAPQVTAEQISELSQQIPEWKLIEVAGERQLQRAFKFDDFAQALEFTDRVGALAEEQNHHPALLTEWGKVTVSWWTHKIHGLHVNDFIMAAKTDLLQPAGECS